MASNVSIFKNYDNNEYILPCNENFNIIDLNSSNILIKDLNLLNLPGEVKDRKSLIKFCFLLLALDDSQVRTIIDYSRMTFVFWQQFVKLYGIGKLFEDKYYLDAKKLHDTCKYISLFSSFKSHKELAIKAFIYLTDSNFDNDLLITSSTKLSYINSFLNKFLKALTRKNANKKMLNNLNQINLLHYFNESLYTNNSKNNIQNKIIDIRENRKKLSVNIFETNILENKSVLSNIKDNNSIINLKEDNEHNILRNKEFNITTKIIKKVDNSNNYNNFNK